jgi:hypothetical protein
VAAEGLVFCAAQQPSASGCLLPATRRGYSGPRGTRAGS